MIELSMDKRTGFVSFQDYLDYRAKEKILERLAYARAQHPASQWQGTGKYWALGELEKEVAELRHAVEKETDDRITDEALDVIAVAIRIINREYE